MLFTIPADGVYRIRVFTDEPLYLTFTCRDSNVLLRPLDTESDMQKWNIRSVTGRSNIYKITSLNNNSTLTFRNNEGSDCVGSDESNSMLWGIEFQPPYGSRLNAQYAGYETLFVDASNNTVRVMLSNRASIYQHWAFEQVADPSSQPVTQPSTQPSTQPLTQPSIQPAGHSTSQLSTQSSTQSFENRFFPLTIEQAGQQPEGKEYDIIIVGSGIGGGVLAHDLYETNRKVGPGAAKRILLLEKGGLIFHSHCLNTARQAGIRNERSLHDNTFFLQFKQDYQYTTDSEQPKNPSEGWKSGPMFNLGGRSAAWGLFAPRIHDAVLKKHFPKVYADLLDEYYDKAEHLMRLSLPTTKRVHQHIMDQLTVAWRKVTRDTQVQWQWSRIASKFQDDSSCGRAEGAYSTIDKILEIAMSKPKTTASTGAPPGSIQQGAEEHEHFKTVLHANVRSLSFSETGAVSAVNVQTSEGNVIPILVKSGGKVVLCAGSVNSPAILLRSEKAKSKDTWETALLRHGGLHLTDHDIFTYSHSFHYSDVKHREEFEGMNLQTSVDIGTEGSAPGIVLSNMSIDASSFVSRSSSPNTNLPQITMVFMLQRPLVGNNSIFLDSDDEPLVDMIRGEGPDQSQIETMRELTASAMNSLKEAAGLRFVGFEKKDVLESDIKLEKLDLGGVAHELGTLPMATGRSQANCLDENLRIVPKLCDGVYVCDLSCFPYSPESNPTLTLAALAIRLSHHLHPRRSVDIDHIPSNQVRVVNHSGVKVRIWLSNHQPNESDQLQPVEPEVELDPGKENSWTRDPNTVQVVFVYWPDLQAGNGAFQDEPVFIKAYPGKLVTILT